jgi:hypothetical protein
MVDDWRRNNIPLDPERPAPHGWLLRPWPAGNCCLASSSPRRSVGSQLPRRFGWRSRIETSPLDRLAVGPAVGAPLTGEPMLIEGLMPSYDAVRAEHRIVAGEIATVYAATRRADFIRAWRESPAVRVLFAPRGVGERAISLIARREHHEPPPPESMRLADMPTHGDSCAAAGRVQPPKRRRASIAADRRHENRTSREGRRTALRPPERQPTASGPGGVSSAQGSPSRRVSLGSAAARAFGRWWCCRRWRRSARSC